MASEIDIGLLSPESSDSPHFARFQKLLPPEIRITIEGLNLISTSRYDLEDKADQVVRRALELKQRVPLQGLIVSGAGLAILNPGLETKVSEAVRIPVVTAPSASVAALKALHAKRLVVITPFDEPMNARLRELLQDAGLNVISCPAFEDPTVGSGAKIGPDELFHRTVKAFGVASAADAIYFQGARLDPLLIIQRVEEALRVPVIASNPAMLWRILSLVGHRFSIPGYGMLLSDWPA